MGLIIGLLKAMCYIIGAFGLGLEIALIVAVVIATRETEDPEEDRRVVIANGFCCGLMATVGLFPMFGILRPWYLLLPFLFIAALLLAIQVRLVVLAIVNRVAHFKISVEPWVEPLKIWWALQQLKSDRTAYKGSPTFLALGERGAQHLRRVLTRGHRTLRINAAWLLGRIKDATSAVALVQILRDPDCEVRKAAAEALSDLAWEPNSTSDRLYWAFAAGKWDGVTREHLVDAAMRDIAARLLDSLRSPRGTRKWKQGIESLFHLPDGAHVDFIMSALEPESVGCILLEVMRCLFHYVTYYRTARTEDSLPEWVNPASQRGLFADLELVGWISASARCTKTADRFLRPVATAALGKTRNPVAVETLAQLVDDGEVAVRIEAVWSLQELGNQAAIEVLLQTVKDKRHQCRCMAAKAVAATGSVRALEVLIAAVKDCASTGSLLSDYSPSYGVYVSALEECLSKVREQITHEELLSLAEMHDFEIRWTCTRSYGDAALGDYRDYEAPFPEVETISFGLAEVRALAREELSRRAQISIGEGI